MGDEHGPTAAGNAAARYAEAMERCQRERPELWSRLETFEIKAVDEFLPPPRQEKPLQAEALKALFRRFKSMETGYLEVSGLEGLCKALAKQYSRGKEESLPKKETLHAVRRLLDGDGDGMVTENEFTRRFNLFWQRRQEPGGLLALVENFHPSKAAQAKAAAEKLPLSNVAQAAPNAEAHAMLKVQNELQSLSGSGAASPRAGSPDARRVRRQQYAASSGIDPQALELQAPEVQEASGSSWWPSLPGVVAFSGFGSESTGGSPEAARQKTKQTLAGQAAKAFGANRGRPNSKLKGLSGGGVAEDENSIPPSTGGTGEYSGDEGHAALEQIAEVEDERDALREKVAALEAQLSQSQIAQAELLRIDEEVSGSRSAADESMFPNFSSWYTSTEPADSSTLEDSPLKAAPPARRESILEEVKTLVSEIQEPNASPSVKVLRAESPSLFSDWSQGNETSGEMCSPLQDGPGLQSSPLRRGPGPPSSPLQDHPGLHSSPLQDGLGPSPHSKIEPSMEEESPEGSPNKKLVQAAAISPLLSQARVRADARRARLKRFDPDNADKDVLPSLTEELMDVAHSRSSPIQSKPSPPKDTAEAGVDGVQVLQALRTCRICLEELRDVEELRALPCSHYFHKGCLDRWLRINFGCPLCRKSKFQGLPSTELDKEIDPDDQGVVQQVSSVASPAKSEPAPFWVLDECWDVAYCDLLCIVDGDEYCWVAQELRIAPLPPGVVPLLRADNVVVGLPNKPELAEEIFSLFDDSTMVLFLHQRTGPDGVLDVNVSQRHPYQLAYERIIFLAKLIRNFKNVQWEPLIDAAEDVLQEEYEDEMEAWRFIGPYVGFVNIRNGAREKDNPISHLEEELKLGLHLAKQLRLRCEGDYL